MQYSQPKESSVTVQSVKVSTDTVTTVCTVGNHQTAVSACRAVSNCFTALFPGTVAAQAGLSIRHTLRRGARDPDPALCGDPWSATKCVSVSRPSWNRSLLSHSWCVLCRRPRVQYSSPATSCCTAAVQPCCRDWLQRAGRAAVKAGSLHAPTSKTSQNGFLCTDNSIAQYRT